jgi:hypothetical protein
VLPTPFTFVAMAMPTTDDSAVPMSAIQRILVQNNFAPKPAGGSAFRLPNASDSAISIQLTSEAELERLYSVLKKIPGITGRVSNAKFESIDAYKSAAFQRLYERARYDAQLLAGISDGSIGKLISVQELSSNSMADMMADYSKTMMKSEVFSGLFGAENPLIRTVERKLLFRFELK